MKYVMKYVMILCLYSIISCKEKQNTTKINSLKNIVNNNLGEKLKIPDSLEVYYPFSNSHNKEMLNSELKIYSHIDASCGTCIENLQAWNKLIPELNEKDVQVYLICSSDDKFELLKYFFESKEIDNFHHYLFLDYNNQYIKQNGFMLENKNFETVLINDYNEILLMGEIIFSREMKELYFSEIEKISNKNH